MFYFFICRVIGQELPSLFVYVGTSYVDATRFSSTGLGSAQARRSDIPPSYAPEFDTRSTESREPIPADTSP
ncbi:hypothetical protein Hanom_Chr04g00346421 [Helianthus anomalus]